MKIHTILEELLFIHQDIETAHTDILKWIEEKLPPEPTFWTNMSKGLRNYNEGKRDYRKQALKNLGIKG